MTYKEIINLFEKAAMASGVVSSFYYGDINIVNTENNLKYPVLILTPQTGQVTTSRLDNFHFGITYVDRLTENRYKRDIHSSAYLAIKDICNRFRSYDEEMMEDGGIYTIEMSSINFYSGIQNFADALSGGFVNISVETDNQLGECFFTDNDECDEVICGS